jgi:osmotically-inducible protein OsmY
MSPIAPTMKILPFSSASGTRDVAAGEVGNAIDQLAERRLRESPYFFLKRLSCRFDSGTLTLTGQVPHIKLKHFAEEIVARVDGVATVVNRVIVFDPAASPNGHPAVRNAG